ncbi:MAG: serine/threonine-protein kinase [Pyrinomonadaceae bacterium]
MTPQRWQQVCELFEATLARDNTQRAAFLSEVCADDEELRQEVDSLISAHGKPDSLFDQSLSKIAAEILTSVPTTTLVGRQVGSYTVERELGRGGMSEVYLAHDARLNRLVALKLLSVPFTRDADRLQRFEREARAVSALNHPNIVTIHEIDVADDLHFIITEYIEGETLRQIMQSRPLKFSEALDISIQTATALTAAHQVGIIHRDIKPENIMVRRDGYVKVLDFGLAKLIPQETHSRAGGKEAATLLNQSTSPGSVMGTVAYMSPEQARGHKVDQRADIWSLGCVLYETVAGRAPFEGATPSDVIASVLTTEPTPITDHSPSVPEELQRIIDKALAKDVEERYQDIRDLRIDLQRLKRES